MKKALVLTLVFVLILLNTAAFAEYDPVVVQVNEMGYTRSQVREALDMAKASYVQLGNIITDEIEEKMTRDVLEYFIRQGVLENKANDLRLLTPTKEDIDEIEEEAQKNWEEAQKKARDELVTKYGLTAEKAQAYAEMYLDLTGITLEELRLEVGALWKQSKITEFVTKDVPRVTDDEAREWYNKNMVKPSEEAYRDNIEAFETDVVLNGADCYYVPGEYRYVQSIVFLVPDEEREAVQLKMLELRDAQAALTEADNAVYGCQVLEEDPTEALARQAEAQARVDTLTKEIQEMKKAQAEPFAAEIEDIEKRLEAGENFFTLRKEYDQNAQPVDEGYLVCAESLIWEDAFREGAMALEKPGDYIGPIYVAAGPQFLYYVKDAPRGALPLNEEDLAAVLDLAQNEADNKLLLSYIDQWQKEYDVVTHEELLKLS